MPEGSGMSPLAAGGSLTWIHLADHCMKLLSRPNYVHDQNRQMVRGYAERLCGWRRRTALSGCLPVTGVCDRATRKTCIRVYRFSGFVTTPRRKWRPTREVRTRLNAGRPPTLRKMTNWLLDDSPGHVFADT